MPQESCAPFYLLRCKPRLALGPLTSEIRTPPGINGPDEVLGTRASEIRAGNHHPKSTHLVLAPPSSTPCPGPQPDQP